MRRHARQNPYSALACLFVFLGLVVNAIASWRAVWQEVAAFTETLVFQVLVLLMVMIVQVGVSFLLFMWLPTKTARLVGAQKADIGRARCAHFDVSGTGQH